MRDASATCSVASNKTCYPIPVIGETRKKVVARRPKNLLIFLAACFIVFEKQLESVRRKDRKEFRFQKSRQSYSFQIYEKFHVLSFSILEFEQF